MFEFAKDQAGFARYAYEQGQEQREHYSNIAAGAERGRSFLQSKLGTDEQMYAPYIGKWSTQGYDTRRRAEYDPVVNEANSLLSESLAAARAGDLTKADQLKAQANNLVSGTGQRFQFSGPGAGWENKNEWDHLKSPEGRLAGTLLRDAMGMQDPNSAGARSFVSSLTEAPLAEIEASRDNALRSITAGERGASRSARDFRLAHGAAHAPSAEASVAARTSMEFATQRASVETQTGAARAQVTGQARQTYETFKRAFAVDAMGAAQQWVDTRGGVRDEWQAVNIQLAGISAQIAAVGAEAGSRISAAAFDSAGRVEAAKLAAETEEKLAKQDLMAGIAGKAIGIVAGVGAGIITGNPLVGAQVFAATQGINLSGQH
jgi:hypothetical protein